MKRSSSLMRLFGMAAIVGILVGACAPAATPTAAPTDTAAPAPTSAPAATNTSAPAPTAAPAATNTAAPTAAPTAVPATAAPTAAPFTGLKFAAPDCKYGGEFLSMEAVDASTVKFTLCAPDPAFPSKVAFGTNAIQSQKFLDAAGGDSLKMSDQTNGTGPYMLKEWVKGDHITLVANPNYWGPAPVQKTLIFRWSKEAAQRLLELQAGTVDGIDNPAPDDFDTIKKDTTLQLIPRPALNIFYLAFNDKIKPFDNEKVRQAIAMGIDRQRLVDNFYPAGSAVADQFVPDSFSPGFSTTGDGAKWYTYDLAAAKKMLADAGFPNGFTVDLAYRSVVRGYLPLPDKVAQDLQAQLKNLGITVKLNVMESTAFLDATSAGKVPFYMLGWGADYPDPTDFYDYHFSGTNKQFGDQFPDLVSEIKAAATVADPAQRQLHYDKVAALVKQHVPMIPIAHGGSAVAYKASVKNAHTSPIGNEFFPVMDNGTDQFVFMQNGEPGAIWCGDESDGESLRVCNQLYDALLGYKVGGVEVVPGLAEKWEANTDLSVWTFHLRQGVKFSNGDLLTANDVVASYDAQWDTKSPNHKGRTGSFDYWGGLFTQFLNAPPPK